MMELIVISPEGDRVDEHATLDRLFAAGLQRYQVRKPGWDGDRLRRWLEGVAPKWRSRLTGAFGRHWKDEGSAPLRPGPGVFSSRSCHDLETLRASCGGYDAIFFGPVWPSESKPERPSLSAGDMNAVREYLGSRSQNDRRATIYALSGITPGRVAQAKELGFDGIAVMSGIWGAAGEAANCGVATSSWGANSNSLANCVHGTRQAPPTRGTTGRAAVESTSALVGPRQAPGTACDDGVSGPGTGDGARAALGTAGADGEARPGSLDGARAGAAASQNPLLSTAPQPEEGVIGDAMDAVQRFRRYQMACFRADLPPLLCLTQDGVGVSQVEQVRRLCAAGAKWIQVRVKGAGDGEWETICREAAAICRDHGVLCTINDRADLALKAGAPSVHLGKDDGVWRQVPGLILGGTVNDVEGAGAAVAAHCLDYVGVGPWRFTTTKKKLSTILGPAGVEPVISALQGLPAWVIGGVQAEDLPSIRALGAAGAAVSSALYRDGAIETNYRILAEVWHRQPEPASLSCS